MMHFAGFLAAALMSMALVANGATAQQIKASKPGMSMIGKGSCCARVNGVCISACNKSGGCTGKADCTVLKAK